MKPNKTHFVRMAPFFLLIALFTGCSKNPNKPDKEGFVKLFNGKNLDGWEGDSTYWSVEDGVLVGTVTPETILKRNSFIIWRGSAPADFELKLDYRISKDGNSGINYRSVEMEDAPYALRGYQCDIDGANNYTGQNYEEQGRRTLAYHGQVVVLNQLPDSLASLPISTFTKKNAWTKSLVTDTLGEIDDLNASIKSEDWNEVHLVVKGNSLKHFVNGTLMSEVTDYDTINRKMEGLIGVQVHVGPPMKIEYRNIRLKEL